MLKNNYKYMLLQVEMQSLKDSITETYYVYGETNEVRLMLPLSILQDVQKRIIGALAFPESKMKLILKKNEALAFHALYMSRVIESTFVTQQINTVIHKTL